MSVETHHDAAPASTEILVATGLSYAYLDRYRALDDVSVTIQRGERVALLGANGCGKSTLLKVLDGLIFPSAGSGVQRVLDRDPALASVFAGRWVLRVIFGGGFFGRELWTV